MAGKVQSLSKKFWAKVDKRPGDQCWEWLASKATTEFNGGYGKMGLTLDGCRLMKQATHVAWFLEHGRWPENFICHRCDNPGCVRVSHLFEGTPSDNAKDAYSKGRLSKMLEGYRGMDHPRSKLTERDVVIIRHRYRTGKVSQQKLADAFDVHQTLIGFIVRGEAWKCVVS